MTIKEFSDGFDTLVNSFSALESHGQSLNPLNFDEYEKSVFLTKAQEEIIENLYTGKLIGDSFESTELLRRYLSDLVKTVSLSCRLNPMGISEKSVFAVLPVDLWFITYESATLKSDSPCIDGKIVEVIPVTLDEYHRIKDNPFRGPNSKRVLRLDVDESRVELISKEYISSYLVRYIARPNPIILVDLPDGLSINNQTEHQTCKLNPGIHRMILDAAVRLAVQSRIPNTGS